MDGVTLQIYKIQKPLSSLSALFFAVLSPFMVIGIFIIPLCRYCPAEGVALPLQPNKK